MNVPSPPVLRPDEFPDAEPRMLQLISAGFRDVFHALVGIPSRVVRSGSFMSASAGVSTVSLKNPLPSKPAHLSVSLRRDDLSDFSAAWSWWFVVSGEQVVVKFIGLPASTRCVYSVEFS